MDGWIDRERERETEIKTERGSKRETEGERCGGRRRERLHMYMSLFMTCLLKNAPGQSRAEKCQAPGSENSGSTWRPLLGFRV